MAETLRVKPWPASTSNGRKTTRSPNASRNGSPTSLRSHRDDSRSTPPSIQPAVAAAIATPHDAALAELYGQRGPAGPAKNDTDAGLGMVASAGSLDRTASPSAGGLRSGTVSPDPSPELVYDPFSGAPTGFIMLPRAEREREPIGNPPLDQVKDELWAHLARIRELQSEIAGMHVQMEGIGSGDVRGTKRAPVGRVHSDTIHATEEWEDPEEAEQLSKAARDAEFTHLTEAFKTRRTAIDGIMDKLGDLSKSLTTFHALPTPMMDLASTRSTTKESAAVSPDLLAPTRSSTAASRPDHAAPFPESPTSIEAESPVAVRRA